MEKRFLNRATSRLRVETRADKPSLITGYAAVFYRADDPGTQYPVYSDMVERIMPGCFDKAVAEDDVRGLAHHDQTLLLGRSKAATLRLKIDEIGLLYEIDAPDTQAARDLIVSINRGDLDGSSFGFSVWGKRGTVTYRTETVGGKSLDIREIRECELFDVGPVTYPAYEATSAEARSRDTERLMEERRKYGSQSSEAELVAVMARCVEIG